MLELKQISKSYKTENFEQKALNEFSLKFRRKEFISILGASGSGKTTLLNIIGGLDRYDTGDLIINNKSTKQFKEKDWNAYRNNCIGFIFQNYNLISHITILENIEMGMTLSGISKHKKKKKALEALEEVGLKEHAHKKPNQLSGGQMQRVAIARALANNPDIILADEPTGALDSKTSKQIMNLIKKISKDKLVIMVTHNKELAEKYSTRIVELKDGILINDSNPVSKNEANSNEFNINKTSMSFLTALSLSFNNIKTKKGRTALTAFASSIGIIGIALILSLSNGFKIEVDNFEKDSLSESPIVITEQTIKMDEENISKMQNDNNILPKYPKEKKIYIIDDILESMTHTNKITSEYIDYINKIDKKDVAGISLQKATSINIVNYSEHHGYNLVTNTSNGMSSWNLLPSKSEDSSKGVVENNYDIIAGKIDEKNPGLILQVNNRNQIYSSTLKQLGLEGEQIDFQEILNKKLKVILNNDYYNKVGQYYIPNTNYESLYNSNDSITIKVQAIIRGKEEKEVLTSGSGIYYTNTLVEQIINHNKNSMIVKEQQEKDYNILTGQPFDKDSSTNTKEMMLGYLGAESVPKAIYIYPNNFESKDKIVNYLEQYNNGKKEQDKISYIDMASMISALSGNIMDAITIVLIAFSSISLIVSSVMIGIITYISVLERTKEIGILRALGARRKDIKRVFNAETFIIGTLSGILGILIARILIIPINIIIKNLSQLSNVAKLNPFHAIILIAISVTLTVIGGLIPAGIASRKNPVEALRVE